MSHHLYDGLFEHTIDYHFHSKVKNEKIPLALVIECGSGQATVEKTNPFFLKIFCGRITGIDVEIFLEEAKRILKPHTGVLAIWTYTFGTLDNPIVDSIYHEFHHGLLFPYWNAKQRLVDDYYELLVSLFPYKSTLRQYTIECQVETTFEHFLGFIETASACRTFRKQNGEQAYQDMFITLRHKLIQCYIKTKLRHDNDGAINFNFIKLTLSRPIRLYLMQKMKFNFNQ
ncbi:unnamed protein product [Rotaria magnacalcarata]|uniref:Uncharacterized protein n=1 Tax=Rotaria magnacalcarata TaxID=392030 RepID=A0A816X6T0_9BILA|nr:unnamed protein product [Rotaria magnacalcarata]